MAFAGVDLMQGDVSSYLPKVFHSVYPIAVLITSLNAPVAPST